MITLYNMAVLIQTMLGIENVYAGNIDGNQSECVGVYALENHEQMAVGGKANTKTIEKGLSILLHWGENPSEAEKKVLEISDVFVQAREIQGDGFILHFVQVNKIVSVARDERGICEYVIEANFICEET